MKKSKILTLVSLTLLLAGCSGTNSETPASNQTSANPEVSDNSATPEYPNVFLSVKALASEVEIGQTVEVRAIISASNGVNECEFVSSDTSIATVTVKNNGVRCDVKGVAEGEVTITVTSKANPTVSKSVKITVIKEKPSLRQALKTIQGLDSYTLHIGTSEKGSISDEKETAYITKDGIIHTDFYGNALYTDSNGNNLYGELVNKDNKVIYLAQRGTSFITNAPIVQTNVGLLTKDNFLGTKDSAKQPFEVGMFYSYNAINPDWVTDTKADDNTYVIDGEALDENKVSTNIHGAYLEAQLWKLADPTGYAAAVTALNEDYYYSLAAQVTTTITVTSSNSISVSVEEADGTVYQIDMGDQNNTTLEDAGLDYQSTTFTTADPVEASDLEAGIAAVKTNNYVQANSMFPDHQTEVIYYTYFTPDYVFYDCTGEFQNEYNTHLSDDNTTWDKTSPYGYVKRADGVYSFTYDEKAKTVSVASTKEANTDASTSLPEFAKYFSTISTFSADSTLKYSFGTKAESIWSNHSTKYYVSTSRTVFDEFINYYAPEDIEDIVENVKSGFGVVKDSDGKVTEVNGTLGFTPFTGGDNDITKHTYGVDYFNLTNFGSATTNDVDSLLTSYINR